MLEIVVRILIGGAVVSAFASFADVLEPKSFAGLFGAAPSVALASLALTVGQRGAHYASLEAQSMVLGAIAFLVYTSVVSRVLIRGRTAPLPLVTLGLILWLGVAFGLLAITGRASVVKVAITFGVLRRSRWYEYLMRFAFGGLATAVAAVIADRYGPAIGGLFLAFPAIFPASATLLAKHEKERRRQLGLPSTVHSRIVTGVDAAGAAMGSVGLVAFAIIVWRLIPEHPTALVLAAALFGWLAVAVLVWLARRTVWRMLRVTMVRKKKGPVLLGAPQPKRAIRSHAKNRKSA